MTTSIDIDLEKFWRDNAIARDDPFGEHIPQVAMSFDMNYDAMYAEIGAAYDPQRLESDYDWARRCARAYNDRAEQIVGKRLLNETQYDPSRRFPAVKSVGELFGCPRVWQSQSWWLLEAAHTPGELTALLDRMEKLDVEAAMYPADWDAACRRIYGEHGIRPAPMRTLRGPVTLATSIYGSENLLYLILDDPPLAARFRDVITKVLLDYFEASRRRSDPALVLPVFGFQDDNCALLNPDMYRFFGQPILQAVFDRFASGPGATRHQHSDSDMAHLLPLLAETGINHVNFGPSVRFAAIRKAMPRALVSGTLSPLTFMRNDEPAIEYEVRRDIDEARDTRGLIEATAGGVNNGTRLTSLRKVMQTIVQFGRFDTPSPESPQR